MLDKNVIAHPRYVGRTHEKEKIPFQVIQNYLIVFTKITIWKLILLNNNKISLHLERNTFSYL